MYEVTDGKGSHRSGGNPTKSTVPTGASGDKDVTISAPGKKPVSFHKGGLHETTHTPMGENIPASKMAAAKRGDYGPLGKKQANMATGMLAAGRRTAAKNR